MDLYDKVIKEVEQSPEGPHIGAFFDFDGTIIYGYSAITYLREQIRRGDVKPRQLVDIVRTMTSFGLGNMGFSAMMSATSKYLKGIHEKEYIEFGEKLYKEHIAKLIYPESRALIEAHLKKGHTVALVSAATPYQVTAAAKELGIEHVRCTKLETVAGRFTGEVIKPTCYGMGKVAAAQGFETSHGVQSELSYFYSDSDEDIQLLEYVGKPRPLNPNTKLRRIASGRGWPVQDFNSRGSVGVKDYVRTFATQGSMVTAALAGLPMFALTRSVRKSRNFSTSLFADLATAIGGIELDITGEEHVWTNRPCVFIFNHQSQADTIILPALLRRDLAGVGKKEIGDVPVIGKLMQYGGTVLIDRENTASALEAMAPLVDVMKKEGRSVCLAPEGTRSTSTNLGRFKKGAFHLALQAQVPIVPIVIHNAIDVAPRGQFVIRPATVKITVLPPVDTSDWEVEKISEHVDQVRDLFLVELDQMVLQKPQDKPALRIVDTGNRNKAKIKSKAKTSKANKAKVAKAKIVKERSTKKATAAASKKLTKKLAEKSLNKASKKVSKKVSKNAAKTTANKVGKTAKVAPASKTTKSRSSVTAVRSQASPLKKRRAKKKAAVKVSARQVNEQLTQPETKVAKKSPLSSANKKRRAKRSLAAKNSSAPKVVKKAAQKNKATSKSKGSARSSGQSAGKR